MNNFYVTEEGKTKTWKPTKEEFEQYREVCFAIWGGMPLDVSWALGTKIYQDKVKQNKL